ncbi:ImcF-related family protein [Cupriavidus basilensis]|uniref:ImcF-related family protein n=1 Tax=Cupriavidus basilensis TaxID=68895 RepID=UPI000751397B|nr:ImcF-related family protein [Cupriavidus basilensis]
MTTPTNNLQALASGSKEAPKALTPWAIPLFVFVVAVVFAIAVWTKGDVLGITTLEAKITWLLWIAGACGISLALYTAVILGVIPMSRRRFAKESGDKTVTAKAPKRDLRLQQAYEELRFLLGWRWRNRVPWLMLCGEDAAIQSVAPGLQHAGVWRTDDAILVHSSPTGIEPALWRKQLRQLRCRRPVDVIVQVGAASDTEPLRAINTLQATLGRAAPVVFLHPVPVQGRRPDQFEAFGAFVADTGSRRAGAAGGRIDTALASLEAHAVELGVQRCYEGTRQPLVAYMSAYISKQRARIAASWAAWDTSHWRRGPLAGVMFAPIYAGAVLPMPEPAEDAPGEPAPSAVAMHASEAHHLLPASVLPAWRQIGEHAGQYRSRRVGIHPVLVLTVLAFVSIGLWTAGMVVSGLRNSADLSEAQQAIHAIQTATKPAQGLHALLALQKQIERYEYRTQHHAPWLTRFGPNRDAEVLAALWEPYAQASRRLLIIPIQQNQEASLVDLARLQTTTLDDKTSQWALAGRDGLKAYLMLAHPERVEPGFLAKRLPQDWSTEAHITRGEKQDLAERLFKFYAQHLKDHPDWRIEPRPALVAGARQTLLAVIGARNAQDTLYQGIVNGAGNKYPDLTLPSLTAGTEARGLLRSSTVVPGIFTRQAYEGYVADAIDAAAKRRDVSTDWVLAGGKAASAAPDKSAAELHAALTEQYFADYAQRWQDFMNNLQWESAGTLPAAIDQLRLLADARQSPVIALMKSLAYQGAAGVQKASLSDTLANKAKDILGKKDDTPDSTKAAPLAPLDAAFGPVLRLMGQAAQAGQGGNSDLSLQRYLDRITALRLHLQQVNSGADGAEQARQMAQTLFQGKSSDLADTQAYGQLVSASLGAEWANMGEALFVQPVVQATQTIVLPAQASLNEAWQRFVVPDWDRTFAGRYPFANTANDASLPEFARFMRPQGGVIPAFLATELAGVLELRGNEWVPAAGAHGVTFDPQFLKFLNALQHVATHMLVQGDPQYHFEVKPIATPGLTDTKLTIDGQKLHYYNQRETWQRMTWPANTLQEPGTILQWQTLTAGTNKNYEYYGRFAFLRMLARGDVERVDAATYQISWPAVLDTRANPDDKSDLPQRKPLMMRFLIRAEAGAGPLDMLALPGLQVAPRIFLVGKNGAAVVAPSPAVKNKGKAKRGGA